MGGPPKPKSSGKKNASAGRGLAAVTARITEEDTTAALRVGIRMGTSFVGMDGFTLAISSTATCLSWGAVCRTMVSADVMAITKRCVRSHCHHEIAFFVMPITAAGQQAVIAGTDCCHHAPCAPGGLAHYGERGPCLIIRPRDNDGLVTTRVRDFAAKQECQITRRGAEEALGC